VPTGGPDPEQDRNAERELRVIVAGLRAAMRQIPMSVMATARAGPK